MQQSVSRQAWAQKCKQNEICKHFTNKITQYVSAMNLGLTGHGVHNYVSQQYAVHNYVSQQYAVHNYVSQQYAVHNLHKGL